MLGLVFRSTPIGIFCQYFLFSRDRPDFNSYKLLVPINVISYHVKESEFEVQSALFSKLKDSGIVVRGSVPAICDDDEYEHKVYLDIVVFRDDTAIAIIEVKNWTETRNSLNPNSRQCRRYSKFGVPVLLCPNSLAIDSVIEEVLRILNSHRENYFFLATAKME